MSRDTLRHTLLLGALVTAAGCAAGLPRLVRGSNITLPRSEASVVRDLLLGCDSAASGHGRPAGGCGSVIGGTREPNGTGGVPGQKIP